MMCGRRAFQNSLLAQRTRGATYTDQDGNTFLRKNIDALRASVLLARKYAADLGQPVWNEDIPQ